MAGPHRAGQSLAAQPGSAGILITDAIGDTLPEAVGEFACFWRKSCVASYPSGNQMNRN
jgi:hypothetical protein